jgi:hypothetical protein
MTTQREGRAVTDMPTACVHGESTDRRCDICFATQARTYMFHSDGAEFDVFVVMTPTGETTEDHYMRRVPRQWTASYLAQLDAADYWPCFVQWVQQLQATMRLHGDEREPSAWSEDQVDLAKMYTEHTTPLAAYRLVAVRQ